MKRYSIILVIFALLVCSCSRYTVYSVQSKPNNKLAGGLLYALPYTQLRVAVTFDKADYACAPFAPYAHDLLGIAGVGSDSVYSIRSIEVQAVNQPDPRHYYFVRPNRIAVNVDPRGLLRSVGMPADVSMPYDNGTIAASETAAPPSPSSVASYNLYDRADTFYTRNDRPGTPSFVSAKKDVRSVRQRAVAAAEEIKEISDKQQQLLFGEYEISYDGDALRYINGQLEDRRQQLLAQFTGSVATETVVFTVDIRDEKTLIDNQTVEIFQFSPILGLVDSTVDDAMMVSCNIRCDNMLRNAARFVRHRTQTVEKGGWRDLHTFKYRIPETASVTVYGHSRGSELPLFEFQKTIKVAQFGTVANLPGGKICAAFDPATGDLVYFNK